MLTPSPPADAPRSAPRMFVWVLLGVLLLQASWVLAVPPFRGLDEHDHVFKAAATARGDFGTQHETSSQGWGQFLSVPRDLVEAAQPVCEDLPYTTSDNCSPGTETAPGEVRVASAMANVNPAFYAVIGTAARPFDGVSALYAMRLASALLSSLMLALGLVAVRGLARGPLVTVGLLLALTPVLLYSTAVAAPNGLEMASGLLVWGALLRALSEDVPGPGGDRWMRLATLGAVPLVTLRALGPVWLLLIVASVAVWAGWPRLATALQRRNTWACIGTVGAATAAAALWIVAARPNQIGSPVDVFDTPLWIVLPQQWVVWFVQSVAAIPARNELAPLYVYVIAFLAWLVLAAVAVRVANRRQRMALLMVFVLATLVPCVATALFYESLGTAWQGRYSLPLTLGFFVLCGLILDAKLQVSMSCAHAAVAAAGVVTVVVTVVTQLHVVSAQARTSPLAADVWSAPPWWMLVGLTVSGMAILTASSFDLSPKASAAMVQLDEAATHRSSVSSAAPLSTASAARPIPAARHSSRDS